MSNTTMKVISGGQTGIDQLALRCAKESALETGGVMPIGFRTSSGCQADLEAKYSMTELKLSPKTPISAQYIIRSKQNVDKSDATLAFMFYPSVGTSKTVAYGLTHSWKPLPVLSDASSDFWRPENTSYKPCFVISNLTPANKEIIVFELLKFIIDHDVKVLNVCGHRMTANLKKYLKATQDILMSVFKGLNTITQPGTQIADISNL